ncbi:MAG: YihY/virulence factor BrkB family protein [Desulfonatronovibrionaceae bacterium]
MLARIIDFFQVQLWRTQSSSLTGLKGYALYLTQIVSLAIFGFQKDDCSRRASALTYYTLLSIVPVMAMAFGVAKGFGLEEALNRQLEVYLSGHKDILEKVVSFSYSLLDETRGGLIAGIGFVFLVWSVIKVLNNIELSFNAVWEVEKGRGWVRKITEYMSVTIIAPFLIIISGSITVYISTELGQLAADRSWLGGLHLISRILPGIAPYILVWLVFIFLLMAMPNTRVKLKPALAGGIIAGTLFQIMQWSYITLQVGTVKYNAIYGSFAALPLFLIWLQLSWMIVLLGAELSFAHENLNRYMFAAETRNINLKFRHKICLLVLQAIIRTFMDQGRPSTPESLQDQLKLPPALISQVMGDLSRAGLIVKISDNCSDMEKFQPGQDINAMNLAFVLQTLRQSGTSDIPVPETRAWQTISRAVDNLEKEQFKSPDNILIKNID